MKQKRITNQKSPELFNQNKMEEDVNLKTLESIQSSKPKPEKIDVNEDEDVKFSGQRSEIEMIARARKNAYVPSEDELKIHYTKDYDKFKILKSNRKVDPPHVIALKKSMSDQNLSSDLPIIVNENMEILDGQHRFKANMELGLPIFYKISRIFDEKFVAIINSTSKPWKTEDYLHYYIQHGNEEYKNLAVFYEYYNIALTSAIGLLTGGTTQPGSTTMDDFRHGDFKITHPTHAIRVINMIDSFAPFFPDYSHKTFMNAVSRLAFMKDYNHEHMLQKLETRSSRMLKQADVDGYIKQLNDLYNHNVRKRHKELLFMYAEISQPEPDKNPKEIIARNVLSPAE